MFAKPSVPGRLKFWLRQLAADPYPRSRAWEDDRVPSQGYHTGEHLPEPRADLPRGEPTNPFTRLLARMKIVERDMTPLRAARPRLTLLRGGQRPR